MPSVEEVLNNMNGNGYNDRELLDILPVLTQYAEMGEEIRNILGNTYDEHQLTTIVGRLTPPRSGRRSVTKILNDRFTEKEKRIYLMHKVDGKSARAIAKELNISKNIANGVLYIALAKVKDFEIESLSPISEEMWQKVIEDTPDLTELQKLYFSKIYIEKKTERAAAAELGVSRGTIRSMVARAKNKLNLDCLKKAN